MQMTIPANVEKKIRIRNQTILVLSKSRLNHLKRAKINKMINRVNLMRIWSIALLLPKYQLRNTNRSRESNMMRHERGQTRPLKKQLVKSGLLMQLKTPIALQLKKHCYEKKKKQDKERKRQLNH